MRMDPLFTGKIANLWSVCMYRIALLRVAVLVRALQGARAPPYTPLASTHPVGHCYTHSTLDSVHDTSS